MNPGDPGTPKVDFELDGNAINKLTPYIGVLGTAKACGTVVGEFVHKDGFKGKRVGEIWVGNGFGAQGSYEFGFVLRSVSEIAPFH